MDDAVRKVAWAIADAWWRKTNAAGGATPEAGSSRDYADSYWQLFRAEAMAAISAHQAVLAAAAAQPTHPIASDRFA